MLKGPLDFIPDREVVVIEKRQSFPLAENEVIFFYNIILEESFSLYVDFIINVRKH